MATGATMIVPTTRPDRAIHKSADDKLERSQFIERLTEAVVNDKTCRSTGTVIGITGRWGSGKTSVLNLLHEHLKAKYEDALVVRFDPWLVSGRNDLIAEFLGELIGTINARQKRIEEFKGLSKTLAQYGAQLAPVGNLWMPGIGAIFSRSFQSIEKALSEKNSIDNLRDKLLRELENIRVPIVVLIDEIDRVEDDEIRTVAQLVRSVADFPGVSYVLAYDPERVVQALGSNYPLTESKDFGRAYLEKIVQLQIPLPAIFEYEVSRLLTADLHSLEIELKFPENFESIARYQLLMSTLTEEVIYTLRDIRRLVETFRVLRRMLYGEVDWIDLLAYSALLIKAPETVECMRRNPDHFLGQSLSTRSISRHALWQKSTFEQRLSDIIPASEQNDATKSLLAFLFPYLSEKRGTEQDYSDAMRLRRPLLTTLRLGLLPGAVPRDKITALVHSTSEQIQANLREAYDNGVLDVLIDRLNELYAELDTIDHLSFWEAVGTFIKKPDCKWMTSHSPMPEVIRNFAEVLEYAVGKNENLRSDAALVFEQLHDRGESEFTSYWLRHHIHVYGLFGYTSRSGERCFLDANRTEKVAIAMAQIWHEQYRSSDLIPCQWNLLPVYTMIDTGVWDDECRELMDQMLKDNRALDGFTLMLFGGIYSTDPSTINRI